MSGEWIGAGLHGGKPVGERMPKRRIGSGSDRIYYGEAGGRVDVEETSGQWITTC
jgi:hypothetical protein